MEDGKIAVDSILHCADHGVPPSDLESETTSLASSIYRGVLENGRRYQALREGEYWAPADELQFESLEMGHLVCLLLDSDTPNPFFQSPAKDPKQILDLGTGRGTWTVDVADMYPKGDFDCDSESGAAF